MRTAPLLSREEYLKTLVGKHGGSLVLLWDTQGRLLIVKPNYRPGWGLPGGSIDANESPLTAALRETKEEVGLTFAPAAFSLIAVDYLSASPHWPEAHIFLFDGGVLTPEQASSIVIQEEELDEYRFVPLAEAYEMLAPHYAIRIPASLAAKAEGRTAYLEDSAVVQ